MQPENFDDYTTPVPFNDLQDNIIYAVQTHHEDPFKFIFKKITLANEPYGEVISTSKRFFANSEYYFPPIGAHRPLDERDNYFEKSEQRGGNKTKNRQIHRKRIKSRRIKSRRIKSRRIKSRRIKVKV